VGGVEVPPSVIEALGEVRAALAAHLGGAAWGRAMREGVQVAIAGAPNAGKSSLFNRLVGEDRAIVAAVPGTTRDRVSATVEWEGAPFTLSDTAGLRESDDEVESLGIARTRAALESSRVVLWVVDASAPLPAEAPPGSDARRIVVALNKCDLSAAAGAEAAVRAVAGAVEVVRVSALTGDGVDALVPALLAAAGFEPGDVIASERQAHDLGRACDALARAEALGRRGTPGEIVAIELREAMSALEELLGLHVGEDMLDRIFSKFCVGK
jgi:tRNA modification GTPase